MKTVKSVSKITGMSIRTLRYYDKMQILLTQKSLMEHKRNRLNGIIELINDVGKEINTMNFEAFDDEDIKKIIDYSLELQGDDSIKAIIERV